MTSLSSKLAARHTSNNPIRIGLIGAGKFGSMFMAQVAHTTGMHLAGIADLSIDRAIVSLKRVNYPTDKYNAKPDQQISVEEAIRTGHTTITNDAATLIATSGIDVVMECTGVPSAGVRHALLCCEHKKHIVMVNVEADVLAGPLLVRKAKEAGIIYSMAYGDQPALIAELVDWARTAGFHVVCAGKGTKHLPEYHQSTPDTVWDHYGFTKEQLATGDFNPQMFNSFLDGTKSALEMAAVANACDLQPPIDGLKFPPCSAHDTPEVLKPKPKPKTTTPPPPPTSPSHQPPGTVEVISSLNLNGTTIPNDLRWGVYVIIRASTPYQKDCFAQYGLQTDSTGYYAVQYKPFHLIGLELGISAANIICRGEPTGQCQSWNGDVVAVTKRDLKIGERLDGEGGFMVYGRLTTAVESLRIRGLPVGLASGCVVKRDVMKGVVLSWDDVEFDEKVDDGEEDGQDGKEKGFELAVRIRKEMERVFAREFGLDGIGCGYGDHRNGVDGH